MYDIAIKVNADGSLDAKALCHVSDVVWKLFTDKHFLFVLLQFKDNSYH